MADIVLGLVTYKGAIAALELQDVTYSESGSTIEPLNEDGNVNNVGTYGAKVTIQANGNVRSDSVLTALTFGATLTVDSIAYKITDFQIKESVTGAKTCSISGSAPKPAPAG
ncbi:hypothetical protein SDC9_163211 [bioreactor metagenome]|uniref:Uncharacterized protein n=1 Tax=bioreactor metagenome TaxID=1076179 RepID=A0A645FN77_9ZZZZ